MPTFIIKLEDKYFEWSTIVDAPVTFAMSRDELEEHIKEEYGNEGLRELPERLKRVDKQGTSCCVPLTVEDLISCNRAGDGESELTKEEILEKFEYLKPMRKDK